MTTYIAIFAPMALQTGIFCSLQIRIYIADLYRCSKSNILLFFKSGNIENNVGISNKLLAFILLSLIFLYPSKNTSLSYIFCCAILSSINLDFTLYYTTHTLRQPSTEPQLLRRRGGHGLLTGFSTFSGRNRLFG